MYNVTIYSLKIQYHKITESHTKFNENFINEAKQI